MNKISKLPKKRKLFFSVKKYSKREMRSVIYYSWINSMNKPYYPSFGYYFNNKIFESKPLWLLSYLFIYFIQSFCFMILYYNLKYMGLNDSYAPYLLLIYLPLGFVLTYIINHILLFIPVFRKAIELLCKEV